MSAWGFLLLAGLFEVGWAIGLKYTNGFKILVPSVLTILAMILSMYFLSQAAKELPISSAYPVWVGIGVLGSAIFGLLVFKEPFSWMKLLLLAMLSVSVIGLKIISK